MKDAVGFIVDLSLLVLLAPIFKVLDAVAAVIVETFGTSATVVVLAIIYIATRVIVKRQRETR